MIKNNIIYMIIKVSKMKNQAEFMKRIFIISAWLDKRYNLNSKDVKFDYGYVNDQFVCNKLTIRLTFN